MLFPVAGDVYLSNVALNLPMTGENGGTTFTDISPTPKSVSRRTYGGDFYTSTAISKYGGSSARAAGGSLEISTHTDLNFSSGDFTIEFWFYSSTAGHGNNYATLFQQGWMYLDGCINIHVVYGTNPAILSVDACRNDSQFTMMTGEASVANSTWHHVALVKASGVYTLYVNGSVYATNTPSPAYTHVSGASTYIGTDSQQMSVWDGYFQALRITKGIARYTEAFVVPSGLFATKQFFSPVQSAIQAPTFRQVARLGL